MAHIHELIDFTVSVYIVYEDKVLLRMQEKYGFWAPPGGHIELDEDPVAAAIRECKEEVGLDVTILQTEPLFESADEPKSKELIPPPFMNIHYTGNEDHRHIDLNYFASTNSDKVVPENKDDKWVWLTKGEIEAHADIRDRIKHYAVASLEAFKKEK